MSKFLFFSLSILCFLESVTCQVKVNFSHNSNAEKIYLQLDNEIYFNNKTIWFKGVVLDAASHKSENSSNVLYVQLIDSENKVRALKKIKIESGIGSGHIELDRSFEEGKYLIRAYTKWNLNFKEDFIFEKVIVIKNAISVDQKPIVERLEVVHIDSLTKLLQLSVKITTLDKTSSIRPLVRLEANGKQESFLLENKDDDVYRISHEVLNDTDIIKLSVEIQGVIEYEELLSLNSNQIDLQFFPEGGWLVNGLSSRVGFKFVDANGRGQKVSGIILDESGNSLAAFKSNAIGMGSFSLSNVNINTKYKAKISVNSSEIDSTFSLPQVKEYGTVLRAEEEKSSFVSSVETNYNTNRSLTLIAISRGVEYFSKTKKLVNGKCSFNISKLSLPEGIVALKLIELDGSPILERLVFNKREDHRVNLDIHLNKKIFEQREKVQLKIDSKLSDGSPLKTNNSVLITEKSSFLTVQNQRENILSYFLLSADLKGPIESPGLYFTEDNPLNIDDLLLTQGWSKYNYTKSPTSLRNSKEYGIEVSGVINYLGSNKKTSSTELMLMTFGDSAQTYITKINIPSNFNYQLQDMYGKPSTVLIQPIGISDKEKTKYKIALNQGKAVSFNPFDFDNTFVIADSILRCVSDTKSVYQQRQNKYFTDIAGVTQLDEVVVDSYKLTVNRKKVNERFGNPNVVIDSKEILKNRNEDYSTGLFGDLIGFHDKILIKRTKGNLSAETTRGGEDHITLPIIDGITVHPHQFNDLQYLRSDQISSVEIIDDAKRFKEYFREVFPKVKPNEIPFYGSILAIYTKDGKGLYGGALKKSAPPTIFEIETYDIIKDYYTPKHEDISATDFQTPDLRYPLYWNPNLKANEEGISKIEFYNADITGKIMVIIESISKKGQLGYKIVEYKVVKNEPDD